jgi:hypothetical protein
LAFCCFGYCVGGCDRRTVPGKSSPVCISRTSRGGAQLPNCSPKTRRERSRRTSRNCESTATWRFNVALVKPKRCLYRVRYFFGARVCMRDPQAQDCANNPCHYHPCRQPPQPDCGSVIHWRRNGRGHLSVPNRTRPVPFSASCGRDGTMFRNAVANKVNCG